jgi:excisionase family DNA binding protein
MEKILTAKEMANKLGISTVKLYQMASEGMPHLKVGSHYRFLESKVLAYLEAKK